MINAAANGDEIHLFHRKVHHTPFIYLGRLELEEHNRSSANPSQFIFTVGAQARTYDEQGINELPAEIETVDLLETERNALRKSRVGQGVFRDGLLRLWGGGCAVTGYSRRVMLIASHIKPWSVSTNLERLDPHNGLLLQPTIDRLFDKGLVSFDGQGRLIRSNSLKKQELVRLGVDPSARLRMCPQKTMAYLEYHRDTQLEGSDA